MGFVFSDINMSKNDIQDTDYIQSVNLYKEYIDQHIARVNSCYHDIFFVNEDSIIVKDIDISELDYYGKNINKDFFDMSIIGIKNDIINHDESKYDEKEFRAYRRYFQPTRREKEENEDSSINEELVEEAFKHHYQHNYHHPEFWCYYKRDEYINESINNRDYTWFDDKCNDTMITDPLIIPKMPLFAILHMICDWSAMSMNFQHTLSPVGWYNNTGWKGMIKVMNPDTIKVTESLLRILFDEDINHINTD